MAPRLLALVLLAACTWAQAQPQAPLYVCIDTRGKTHTGDRPPPECVHSDLRVLNRDGSLRQVIAAPLSPEQRAAKVAEDRRKAEEAQRLLEQRRRDRSLLEAYASEGDIQAARAKALASREAQIQRSRDRLARLAGDRKKLDNEAEFYAKREVPNALKRAYVNNAELVKTEERIMADTTVEMDRISLQFDAELARFRELVGGGARSAAADLKR
ncbi:MAG: hypothetical protein RR101_12060 [Burkholderiaceae bacterium]